MTRSGFFSSHTFRKVFRLALIIFLILIIIVAFNAIRFSSKQIRTEAVAPAPVAAEAANRLSEAIRLSTVSYPDRIDTAAFLQLDTLIRTSFPLVDSLLERLKVNDFSQVWRWPGIQPELDPVLLLSHLDVVPVEERSLNDWVHPPFSGTIADGYIWGRGSLDDKISAFSILEAVEQLLDENYRPNRTVYLAFGHDEENRGTAGAQSIARYFSDQQLTFEFVLDEGQVILEEALAGLDPPLAMIGIAEKGYLTLNLEVELPEGGHSSMPPRETAIGILSHSIDKLIRQPLPARIDGATKGLLEFIGPEMSPLYQTLFSNLWLTKPLLTRQLSQGNASNAIIRTTMAPTVIQGGVLANVLPTRARAQINFRILPGETVETVTEYVKQAIHDDRVRVIPDPESSNQDPSSISGIETFGFRVIQKTIREIFPEVVVAPALVIAATDSRYYKTVSDRIYRFLPLYLTQEDLKRIHGINERISVENFQETIRFYRQLLLNSTI